MDNGDTRDTLTPLGKQIVREMAVAMGKPFVKTGFPEKAFGDDHEGPLTVGEVAVFNEFGTEFTPARPFMAMAYEQHRDEMRAFIDREVSLIAQGKSTFKHSLDRVGGRHQGHIRKVIGSNVPPPNSPFTIENKLRRGGSRITSGSAPGAADAKNTTLIDTGQMRQAVTFETVMPPVPGRPLTGADNG